MNHCTVEENCTRLLNLYAGKKNQDYFISVLGKTILFNLCTGKKQDYLISVLGRNEIILSLYWEEKDYAISVLVRITII